MGIIRIALAGITGLLLSKILIEYLGNDTYGIIALFTSFNTYLSLFLIAISGTVYKFVSIEYFREETPCKSVKYFATAFYSVFSISIILLVSLYLLLPWLSNHVDFANNNASDVKFFFMMSASSFLMVNICSVFFVPTMLLSKIYLNDIANIIAVLLRFILVVLLCYVFNNLNLNTYGASLFFFGVVFLLTAITFSKKSMPGFSLHYKFFSVKCAGSMLGMGWKVLLNNIGIILYTNTDIIIINSVLGTLFVTDYSIPLQLAIFVALFGGMMSRLYEPVISQLISNSKNMILKARLLSHTKVFMIFVGFMFILLTVFSMKILNLWLGEEYVRLYFILVLLALYQFLHQSTVLFSRYFNLTNNLSLPLAVTIIAGVGNVFLSFAFLSFTEFGVVGVIIATIITVILKTNIFNTMYTSFLLNIRFTRVLKDLIPLYAYVLIFSYLSFELVQDEITAFKSIDVFSLLMIMFSYFTFAYIFIFNKKEKLVFLRMTKIYSVIKG